MSDDYCVYARNILGRLTDIPMSTGFSTDVSDPTTAISNPGVNSSLMVMAVMLLVIIAFSFLRGESKSEVKAESS